MRTPPGNRGPWEPDHHRVGDRAQVGEGGGRIAETEVEHAQRPERGVLDQPHGAPRGDLPGRRDVVVTLVRAAVQGEPAVGERDELLLPVASESRSDSVAVASPAAHRPANSSDRASRCAAIGTAPTSPN